MKRLLVLFCWLWCGPAHAESREVQTLVEPGVMANAAYWSGEAGKPLVLIVHGLFQTHRFPTVYRLAEGLASNGYSVLAPTLSLGISDRRESLACEAPHARRNEVDILELGVWIDWAVSRGHTDVVLSGHSFGSLQALTYAMGRQRPSAVNQLVLVSLLGPINGELDPDFIQVVRRAEQERNRGVTDLRTYQFRYCKELVATPEAFCSLMYLRGEHLLKAIASLEVPTHAILAEKDRRMPSGWPEKLATAGMSVTVIPGANHFYEGAHEFDLEDRFVELLER